MAIPALFGAHCLMCMIQPLKSNGLYEQSSFRVGPYRVDVRLAKHASKLFVQVL